MRSVLVSFTLRSPHQDYRLLYNVLWSCSQRWIRRDESELLIMTPYSDEMLKLLLGYAIDCNDSLNIYGILSETGINQTGKWEWGGLGSFKAAPQSRKFTAQIRTLALQAKRATSRNLRAA